MLNHPSHSQLLNSQLNTQGMHQMQGMPPMPQYGDPLHHSMNLNGVNVPKQQDQVVYLGAAQPPMGVMPPQSQFSRAAPTLSTVNAKKLWEKGSITDVRATTTGSLGPLQLPSEHPVWRDTTWSNQTENLLASRRTFAQAPDINSAMSAGILRYNFNF